MVPGIRGLDGVIAEREHRQVGTVGGGGGLTHGSAAAGHDERHRRPGHRVRGVAVGDGAGHHRHVFVLGHPDGKLGFLLGGHGDTTRFDLHVAGFLHRELVGAAGGGQDVEEPSARVGEHRLLVQSDIRQGNGELGVRIGHLPPQHTEGLEEAYIEGHGQAGWGHGHLGVAALAVLVGIDRVGPYPDVGERVAAGGAGGGGIVPVGYHRFGHRGALPEHPARNHAAAGSQGRRRIEHGSVLAALGHHQGGNHQDRGQKGTVPVPAGCLTGRSFHYRFTPSSYGRRQLTRGRSVIVFLNPSPRRLPGN